MNHFKPTARRRFPLEDGCNLPCGEFFVPRCHIGAVCGAIIAAGGITALAGATAGTILAGAAAGVGIVGGATSLAVTGYSLANAPSGSGSVAGGQGGSSPYAVINTLNPDGSKTLTFFYGTSMMKPADVLLHWKNTSGPMHAWLVANGFSVDGSGNISQIQPAAAPAKTATTAADTTTATTVAQSSQPTPAQVYTTATGDTPAPAGLSTTQMVIIGAGAVALGGLFFMRKSK